MPPILCVTGKKKSGKTTLLEALVREFAGRGLRVAVVKHDLHGFEMDREGKDTWRLKKAGAAATAVSSPERVGLVLDTGRDLPLEDLAERFFADFDLVLAEGYFRSPHPRIEICRAARDPEPLHRPGDPRLLALVTDTQADLCVATFDLGDAAGPARLIIERLPRPRT